MNVLWLAPFPSPGNHPAPWISVLADSLVAQPDFHLSVLNTELHQQDLVHRLSYKGIDFHYIKETSLRQDTFSLYKIRIKRIKDYLKQIYRDFDLIHIHGSEHQYHVISEGFDIPRVLSIQGIMSKYSKILPETFTHKALRWKIASYYELKYLKNVPYFSCRTHWDTSFAKEMNPQARVFQIWEMIRQDFFADHYLNKKDNILFVGGTNPIKGYVELLQAYNELRAKVKVGLIMVGSANKEVVKKTISQYNLTNIKEGDIEVRGFQNTEGILKAYAESIFLAHPSYIDNSPNSVCEAQIAGLPVIASNVGGVSSLIDDRKTGMLTDLNYKNIAKAMLELYENDQLRTAISNQAKTIARTRHNPETIVRDTLEMYRTISRR